VTDLKERVIDDFEFLDNGKKGTSAVVYQVRRNGHEYALKLFRSPASPSDDATIRFMREAKILTTIAHPGIVRGLEYGTLGPEKQPYILMDFIQGTPLADVLKPNATLPASEALRVISTIASGLAYALASHGILHRDIKLENILQTKDQNYVLIDFGLARCTRDIEDKLASSWEMNGASRYRAPEKWQDFHVVDEKADVWSLGVALYRMLTGIFPFQASHRDASEHKLMEMIMENTPSRPSVENRSVPRAFDILIERLLSKDPGGRPSLEELIDIVSPAERLGEVSQRLSEQWLEYLSGLEDRLSDFHYARNVPVLRDTEIEDRLRKFERWLRMGKSGALKLIHSHPRATAIEECLYKVVDDASYPRMMSVNGDLYPNPIYRRLNPTERTRLQGALAQGERYSVQITPLDLCLVKALDKKSQPLLLQYYSGTRYAGWQTWLFPHGYKLSEPDREHRMKATAADFETSLGLGVGSCEISYLANAPFVLAIKPNFGYGGHLVLYVYLLCAARITSPAEHLSQKEFKIERGSYVRRYRWFYLEEIQQDKTVAKKNGDLVRGIHILFGTSLVDIPNSISGTLQT
jgi:serine/threonine protein kinase